MDVPADEPPQETTRTPHMCRRTIRAMRSRHSRPRELGLILDTLEELNQEFTPLRRHYIDLLKNASNSEELPEADRQRAQRIIDSTCDIMHSFAHAYHAISEINFHVGQRNARLTCDSFRNPMPMQAHINVLQNNRRPQGINLNGAMGNIVTNIGNIPTSENGTSSENSSESPVHTANPATPPSDGQTPTSDPENANRPPTFIIQPDPVTYQVEIETHVPIAFVLDNGLGNNTARNLANGQQNNATDNEQLSPGQTETGINRQSNRIFDLENQIIRGLSQGGGVEVVMSVGDMSGDAGGVTMLNTNLAAQEDTTPTATATPIHNANQQQTNNESQNLQPQLISSGAFVTHVPWGSAPTPELLQNVVSSALRQGVIPFPGGLNFTQPINLENNEHIHVFHTAINAAQGRPAGNADQPTPPNQPRQSDNTGQRIPTQGRPLTSAPPLSSLVFDRFLACHNAHARRHLQQRREQLHRRQQQQQQQEGMTEGSDLGQRTPPAERPSARPRRASDDGSPTTSNTNIFLSPLDEAPSMEDVWNALHLIISHEVSGAQCDDCAELNFAQNTMRAHLQALLQRCGSPVAAADDLISQFAPFLHRVSTMGTFRQGIDVVASLVELLRARMPAVVAALAAEEFRPSTARALANLYTDLCALLAHCTPSGLVDLPPLYRTIMQELLKNLRNQVKQSLFAMSLENLNRILDDSDSRYSLYGMDFESYTHPEFIIRSDGHANEQNSYRFLELSPEGIEVRSQVATQPVASAPPLSSLQSQSLATENGGQMEVSEDRETLSAAGLAEPSTSQHSSAADKSSSSATSTTLSEDGKANLVPLMIEGEWRAVLVEDSAVQAAAGPPAPHSDAYLSGMPLRKRRRLRQARPHAALHPFIAESIGEVLSESGSGASGAVVVSSSREQQSLQAAFRERIREMAARRAHTDPDYERARHSALLTFLAHDSDTKDKDSCMK